MKRKYLHVFCMFQLYQRMKQLGPLWHHQRCRLLTGQQLKKNMKLITFNQKMLYILNNQKIQDTYYHQIFAFLQQTCLKN